MSEVLKVHQIDFSGDVDGAPELAALAALHAEDIPVAQLLVVPGRIEEEFYRTNNLVPQLQQLFRGLNLTDPDEDELEDVAPGAMRLIEEHYLLDEVVDGFYEAVTVLPQEVRIRRPDSAGKLVRRGRASLLELKRIWARDWSVDALFRRLTASGSIELAERPVLLHAADEPAPDEVRRRASALLGREVRVWVDAGRRVTRLEP
jgi:hypothetical protein